MCAGDIIKVLLFRFPFPDILAMSSPPRYPLHQLLTPEFGFGHDVILRVFNGDGEIEGDLKAHGIILALGSVVLKEFLFSNSGVLDTWKVVEARGASLKIAKLMLDFLYMKPDVECGWEEASAEEIFQLASLADQFQIVKLQEKVNLEIIRSAIVVQFKAEAMLSAFPMEKEDILEVASIAVHFETHFPTAAKALLDKCTSLLVSTVHTAEDVARFAEQASKESHLAPLVVKLLAGMGNCKKLFKEVKEEKIVDVKKTEVSARLTSLQAGGAGTKRSQEQKTLILPSPSVKEGNELGHSSVKRGDILSTVLKNVGGAEKQVEVCFNCKALKANCLDGREVRFISPAQVETVSVYIVLQGCKLSFFCNS